MNEPDTDRPAERPDPSKHWDQADRVRVLSVLVEYPDQNGLWHMTHRTLRKRKVGNKAGDGMFLTQLEREGLVSYDGDVWNVTMAGATFLGDSGA